MRLTKTLIIVSSICVFGLLGLGTLAQRGEQDRVFERDGTRIFGRLTSVDAAHVVINGKIIERTQIVMILFPGAMVPTASTPPAQSGAGTDLVTMRNGNHTYGRVGRVTANTVFQNAMQLPRANVAVIEFDVSPPGLIETVEPNEPTPTPTAAPVASPLPPTGYIPAQEKPSPSPATGADKRPAKDQKKPVPKSNCKNLEDFPPAGPGCRTADSLHYGGLAADGHTGVCKVEWDVCGARIWEMGPKGLGDQEPNFESWARWSDSCKNWALGEKKKRDGKSVCCDKRCEPEKPK
jgi:hypothetical protein